MSDHFLGLNKGQEGFKYSDFTYGATTGATDVELQGCRRGRPDQKRRSQHS